MSLIFSDRVGELTTDTGQGSLTLQGALTTYQTFTQGVGDGNTCDYSIVARSGGKWEVGRGTITLSGAYYYLVRTAAGVYSGSSGVGALVDFDSGTKEIKLVFPAYLVSSFNTNSSLAAVYASVASSAAVVAASAAAAASAALTSINAATSAIGGAAVYLVSATAIFPSGKVVLAGSGISVNLGTSTVSIAADSAIVAFLSNTQTFTGKNTFTSAVVFNSSVSVNGDLFGGNANFTGFVSVNQLRVAGTSVGTGTVTSVGTGGGLVGGPITAQGAVSVDPNVIAYLSIDQTITGKKTFTSATDFNSNVSVATSITIANRNVATHPFVIMMG